MSATHQYGFRIVGPCTGDRSRVHAATAFKAYCQCDAKAGVDREGYLSAFNFGDDFREHLTATGSPAGFNGSTWSPFVWLDIDREPEKGGIDAALADTRMLVDVLDETFGVPRELLVPFLSGGKGFHLGIPTGLWEPPPALYFHAVARQFAEMIATEAKVPIDTSVFDRVRAFRAPNSRHPRTGLHKRHVPVDLLDKATAAELLDRAREPAPFEVPSVGGVESADMLVIEWDRAVKAVADRVAAVARRRDDLAEGIAKAKLNRATWDFIRGEDVEHRSRHATIFSAAANFTEVGCSPAACHELCTEPGLNLGLPPKEVTRQINCGIAHAHPLVSRAAELLNATVTDVVDREDA